MRGLFFLNLNNTEIQFILNTMITTKFIKTFSKGQITIPKEFRDQLGLHHEFWLKITINNGKIIAEPVDVSDKKQVKSLYRKRLLKLNGTLDLRNDVKEIRKEIEDKLEKNSL